MVTGDSNSSSSSAYHIYLFGYWHTGGTCSVSQRRSTQDSGSIQPRAMPRKMHASLQSAFMHQTQIAETFKHTYTNTPTHPPRPTRSLPVLPWYARTVIVQHRRSGKPTAVVPDSFGRRTLSAESFAAKLEERRRGPVVGQVGVGAAEQSVQLGLDAVRPSSSRCTHSFVAVRLLLLPICPLLLSLAPTLLLLLALLVVVRVVPPLPVCKHEHECDTDSIIERDCFCYFTHSLTDSSTRQ